MVDSERRSDAPGRRRNDIIARCIWCDKKEQEMRDRWKAHMDEQHEQKAACADVIKELRDDISNQRERVDERIEMLRRGPSLTGLSYP